MFKHSTGHKALSLAAETSASITASTVISALCPPAGVAISPYTRSEARFSDVP